MYSILNIYYALKVKVKIFKTGFFLILTLILACAEINTLANAEINTLANAEINTLANAEINTLACAEINKLTLNILTAFIRLGRAGPRRGPGALHNRRHWAGCPPYYYLTFLTLILILKTLTLIPAKMYNKVW